jgi:hypothetical protein
MAAILRFATILAVTFLGAISVQADEYFVARRERVRAIQGLPGLLKYAADMHEPWRKRRADPPERLPTSVMRSMASI